MKLKKLYFLPLVAVLILLGGCEKEQGCTDVSASNHSSEAEEEDGSCKYEASVIFWFNEAASQRLVSEEAESVIVTLSPFGNSISIPVTHFYTETPVCGKDNLGTIITALPNGNIASASVLIVTNTLDTILQDDIILNPSVCGAFRVGN
jgi:hypothetical protein